MTNGFANGFFQGAVEDASRELWDSLAESKILNNEEVHLWWANPDIETPHTEDYYQILSVAERNRAACYHFRQHRDNFIVTHGLLRIILGRYLNVEPKNLCFIYNEFGKPSLDGSFSGSDLSFNLSHSNGIVLYAFTSKREIGVDIEYVWDSSCLEEIAERVLSPREMKTFYTISPQARCKAFFEYWTCKEAYIKATGRGHSVLLNQIEVFLLSNSPKVPLETRFKPNRDHIWSLQRVESPQGYSAALAVEGNDFRLKNYLWANEVCHDSSRRKV